jgi:hypothetical protein
VLSVLFALSCVLTVSFVCSLDLVHVFRGKLVSFVLFCGGVEPFLPPLEKPVVCELECGSSFEAYV